MSIARFHTTTFSGLYDEPQLAPFFPAAEANYPTRALCKAFALALHNSETGIAVASNVSPDQGAPPIPTRALARLGQVAAREGPSLSERFQGELPTTYSLVKHSSLQEL